MRFPAKERRRQKRGVPSHFGGTLPPDRSADSSISDAVGAHNAGAVDALVRRVRVGTSFHRRLGMPRGPGRVLHGLRR